MGEWLALLLAQGTEMENTDALVVRLDLLAAAIQEICLVLDLLQAESGA